VLLLFGLLLLRLLLLRRLRLLLLRRLRLLLLLLLRPKSVRCDNALVLLLAWMAGSCWLHCLGNLLVHAAAGRR
jgi:hypothetical protein